MYWYVENKYVRYLLVEFCEIFCRFGIFLLQFVWSSLENYRSLEFVNIFLYVSIVGYV